MCSFALKESSFNLHRRKLPLCRLYAIEEAIAAAPSRAAAATQAASAEASAAGGGVAESGEARLLKQGLLRVQILRSALVGSEYELSSIQKWALVHLDSTLPKRQRYESFSLRVCVLGFFEISPKTARAAFARLNGPRSARARKGKVRVVSFAPRAHDRERVRTVTQIPVRARRSAATSRATKR